MKQNICVHHGPKSRLNRSDSSDNDQLFLKIVSCPTTITALMAPQSQPAARSALARKHRSQSATTDNQHWPSHKHVRPQHPWASPARGPQPISSAAALNWEFSRSSKNMHLCTWPSQAHAALLASSPAAFRER